MVGVLTSQTGCSFLPYTGSGSDVVVTDCGRYAGLVARDCRLLVVVARMLVGGF